MFSEKRKKSRKDWESGSVEMLQYLYIDESGDLGTQSKYLIISALLVKNPAELDRIIKNMRRYKFRKQLKKAQEIKANNSSEELIKYMLFRLNDVEGARVFHIVLEKDMVHSSFLKENKHKLYNYVAGKLAQNLILYDLDLEVRVDKSKGKQILREDFNNYFTGKLKEKSSIRNVVIHHSWSHSWSGLQFADIVAWSTFQKFERGDDSYIKLLTLEQDVYSCWRK